MRKTVFERFEEIEPITLDDSDVIILFGHDDSLDSYYYLFLNFDLKTRVLNAGEDYYYIDKNALIRDLLKLTSHIKDKAIKNDLLHAVETLNDYGDQRS
ncbi:hypothetical protein PRVXT_000226 [Proteinivorax tanatarense]|uniref:Uncharacterized protein n=1 Tax=Proteinivorax tanatarense TaxID=1260629 RepID=A0AAU7VM52_9FIRM